VEKRGEVHIAPNVSVPEGSMIDPAVELFGASWQDDEGVIEEMEFMDAEAAVAWGRERSAFVLIRLDHDGYAFFSAGTLRLEDDGEPLPPWPPKGPPPGGWWEPSGDEHRLW
jgi:hypothetical protein